MSSGGGPSSTTTVAKSEPPDYVKPYAIDFMNNAAQLANQSGGQYQGQRIADLNGYQTAGMDATAQRAIQGNGAMNAGNQYLQDTISGKYLSPDSNPYLAQMGNTVANDVQTRMAGMARGSGSGMTNSGWQESTARGLGDALGNLYGNAYSQERGMQNSAVGMAPTYAANDYTDTRALTGVGDAYRQYNQDLLNQGYQDWQSAMNAPYSQLDLMGNAIRTSMGGGGTSTSTGPNPYQASPMANMLGGGLAGYSIGGMMGANPYMSTGLGAAAGGLLR
jgi:hypothetical protein